MSADREAGYLSSVFAITNLTEAADVEFFLSYYRGLENDDERKRFIRGFRNQNINVGAGEMYDRLALANGNSQ